MVDLSITGRCPEQKKPGLDIGGGRAVGLHWRAMDSIRAIKGERDLPEAEKRRPTGLGTVTAVFLLSLPLLLLFFLFGDRAVASIAGDSLDWQRAEVQSTCSFDLSLSTRICCITW